MGADTINEFIEKLDEVEQSDLLQQGTGRDYFKIISEPKWGFGNFPLKGAEASICTKLGTSNLTQA